MSEFELNDSVYYELLSQEWNMGKIRGLSINELLERTKWKTVPWWLKIFVPSSRFALTIGDTIYVTKSAIEKITTDRPNWWDTCKAFHELVHVAQYADKGKFKFLVSYIFMTIFRLSWRKTWQEVEAFAKELKFLEDSGHPGSETIVYGTHIPWKK